MVAKSHSNYASKLYQSAHESQALPAPDKIAQLHSETLIELIRKEIGGQAVSFKRFMELALYAPALGYYAAGSTKLGKEGDFITAPEISPLFSACLANALLPVISSNRDFIILEVGAGSGRMAADILLFLEKHNALPRSYQILELSADLRQRQQQTLAEAIPAYVDNIQWLNVLPDSFSGVVVANELLDAMPVQIFQKTHDGINEVAVAWQDENFVFVSEASDDQRLNERVKYLQQHLDQNFAAGYFSEINFAAEDWIASIADCIQQGMLLLVDYGFSQHEYYHAQRQQGTLMCHYRHRAHADPFVYPGLQDITAHVDFTAMADAALEAGLKVKGYTTQQNFLMGAGLMEIMSHLTSEKSGDIQWQMDIAQQVKKLTLPHEMGELFKVMCLSKNMDTTVPAFMFKDMREYL